MTSSTISTNATEPLLLPVERVAELLGISKRTVWRKLSAGEIVEPLRIGKSVRWRRQDVESWVEQGCPPQMPSTKKGDNS